jgi:hypothetical protein
MVAQRRVREAARIWGYMTLGGISVLSAFVVWHLARRGRLLRASLGVPRQTHPGFLADSESDKSQPGSPRE